MSVVLELHVRQAEMQRARPFARIRLPGRGDPHVAAGIAASAGGRGLSGHLEREHGATGTAEAAEATTQDPAAFQPSGETTVQAG